MAKAAKPNAMINALIASVSPDSISDFVRQQNRSFRPVREDLSYLLSENLSFCQLTKLGEIEYADTDRLLVFSCKIVETACMPSLDETACMPSVNETTCMSSLNARTSRKMQFEIAKKALTADFKEGAIFVFYDARGTFRFSFIRRNYGQKEQKYSNWKRFTYYVEPNAQTNRTFRERVGGCKFESLDAIQQAFSVEPLSKEFFTGYKTQYEKFCQFMQTDKQMQYDFREFLADGTNKAIRDYVKKMLGRIVFLHFIQKKGWLGIACDSTLWVGGDPNFMENLFNNSSASQQENFLDEVLEPLFFNSLNKPRPNDWFNTNTGLGMVKIPYLNGGLFEPDKLDAPDSKFPANYFKELFAFFNRYNFTIDENDPNDSEVGVDPEMLGHIFENLLEDNKDKGAFYTPKEIVHYMCQESLTEYLCTALQIEDTDERQPIEQLVKYHEVSPTLHHRLNDIKLALDKVKICDPAIGSGAFPMGLLQEIFGIKQALWFYEHNDLNQFPASDIKQQIIQNSIYGVDIEHGAVDIARLRFWLSLVVDENIPQPLPNLDYKIVCGDSLISRFALDMPINEVFAEFNKSDAVRQGKKAKLSLDSYKKLVADYTNIHDGKEEFRKIIDEIKSVFKSALGDKDIIKRQEKQAEVAEYESPNLFGEIKKDTDKAGYKRSKTELEALLKAEKEVLENNIYKNSFEWRFEFPALLDDVGNFVGFNIVIGNPPYIKVQTIPKDQTNYFKGKFKSANGKYDIYVIFIEFSLKMMATDGIISFINPHRFLIAEYGIGLRDLIFKERALYKLIHFGVDQIFETATTYTGLFFFKRNSSIFKFAKPDSKDLNDLIFSSKSYDSTSFNFSIEDNDDVVIAKIYKHKRVSEIFNGVFQGLIPMGDDIHVLEGIIEGDFFKGFSKALNTDVTIESKITKPLLKGENIKRYLKPETNNYIFYPHFTDVNGKTKPFTELEMKSHFPKAYNYILNFKNELIEKKIKYKTNPDFWYSLHRSREQILFESPKIITPQLQNQSSFTFDTCSFYADAGGYILLQKENDLVPLIAYLGVFNSKLFYYFIKKTSTPYNNNYYYFKTNYIEPFCIPISININYRIFEDLVSNILCSKIKNENTESLERQIDELVFKLYELTYEEVLVVCPDFWLSEEEYAEIKIE